MLERAIQREPLLVGAYADLAETLYAKGDLKGSEAAIRRGSAAAPRRRADLQSVRAALLVRAGKLQPALRALRAAVPTGPFSDPTSALQQIDILREALRQKRASAPS